jgi:antitoxin component of RelBE/YafQ-DinJ toxin-antitoxin module
MQSTSVRVDRETHEELKRLAKELGTTVGEAVSIAARRLRQQRIGKDLNTPLRLDEVEWLDADLG